MLKTDRNSKIVSNLCLLFYCSIPDHYEPRNYLLPKKQTTISPHLRIVKFCANERTLQNFSSQIEVLQSIHWKRFKTCEVSVESQIGQDLAGPYIWNKTWSVLIGQIKTCISMEKYWSILEFCSLLFPVVRCCSRPNYCFSPYGFYLLNFVVLRVFQTKNDIHFYRLIGLNWYQFSLFAYGVMWFCCVCRWSRYSWFYYLLAFWNKVCGVLHFEQSQTALFGV